MNYWEEAFCAALEEANIQLPSQELIERASKVIEGAHENYGMAHGYDCIPNPLIIENEKLTKELKVEREKVHCRECEGSGWTTTLGPYHSSTSRCYKCNGEGKVLN